MVRALLARGGFPGAEEAFDRALDAGFLACPEDEALLDLEWMGGGKAAALALLARAETLALDEEAFGRTLTASLRPYYETWDIAAFSQAAYMLWNHLPRDFGSREPFFTLCYGGDPLSWNDEAQSRALYEAMFRYGEA